MLPHSQRLARSEDVRAVLRRGRRRAGDLVVVHVRERDDELTGRATAVASRKVGNAVERNRAKRVLRAAIAEVGVTTGCDVALVARRATTAAGTQQVVAELRALFDGTVGAERRVVAS